MISQIYVSRSLIDPADRARMLDDIMAVSIARNTTLDVTGLLIASPDHFAQLLEGPAQGVAAIISSIAADPRHTAFRIVRSATVPHASCPHWRMARFDCDNFGNTVVDPLLMAAHARTNANALRRLERLIGAVITDPSLTSGPSVRR